MNTEQKKLSEQQIQEILESTNDFRYDSKNGKYLLFYDTNSECIMNIGTHWSTEEIMAELKNHYINKGVKIGKKEMKDSIKNLLDLK